MNELECAREKLEILLGYLRDAKSGRSGTVDPQQWQSRINAWLRDDFVLAIEPWFMLPAFRESVLWARNTLARGRSTTLREALDQLSALLQSVARMIGDRERARRAAGGVRAEQRFPVSNTAVTQNSRGLLGDSTAVSQDWVTRLCQEAQRHLDQAYPKNTNHPLNRLDLASITGPLWDDLVNLDDWLWPNSGWNLTADSIPEATYRRLQRTFFRSHSADLLVEQDLLVRSMLCRARSWLEYLRQESEDSLRSSNGVARLPSMVPESRWLSLAGALLGSLESECLQSAEAQLRESCVLLLKVFLVAPNASRASLNWIELPCNHFFFRTQLRGGLNDPVDSALRILTRLKLALGHVETLCEIRSSNCDRIAERIAAGGLVLKMETHEAYWGGQKIQLGNGSTTWKTLSLLAERAKKSQSSVSFRDIPGEGDTRSTLSTRINRLKSLLPRSLVDKITTIRDECAYQLKLDKDQIDIFGLQGS